MRAVADTNTVISALFWGGAPRSVLDAARDGKVTLFTSYLLLSELEEVLSRPKFADRLAAANTSPRELVLGYASLAQIVVPVELEPVIIDDPDDDAVIACALAVNAEFIISGDHHLLGLKRYNEIEVTNAAEFMAELTQ